jgi:hypothetical protein
MSESQLAASSIHIEDETLFTVVSSIALCVESISSNTFNFSAASLSMAIYEYVTMVIAWRGLLLGHL